MRFFLPIGVVPLLIGSTHTMTDAALARMPSPEVMLAVFAVVKALTNAIKAPGLATLQLTVSLIDDQASYRAVTRFIMVLCASLTGVLALLAFTPAGEWAIQNLIGMDDPAQVALARGALPIMLALPLVEISRNCLQGIAIGLRRTRIMPATMMVRIVALLLFFWWAVTYQQLTGVVAGALTWVVGIGLEMVILVIYLLRRFGTLSAAAGKMPARNRGVLRFSDIARFFAPLALMMTVTAWLQPLVQAGLARAERPIQSLAAFGVAWGLCFLLVGPVTMLHQCALVHVTTAADPNWKVVMRFCIAAGVITGFVILMFAVTPLGHRFLREFVGVPASVTPMVAQTMAAFVLWPLIRAVREAFWGLLMLERRTSMIGLAKLANLCAVLVVVALSFGPTTVHLTIAPPVMGALAYTGGEAVETMVIWAHALRRRPRSSIIQVQS